LNQESPASVIVVKSVKIPLHKGGFTHLTRAAVKLAGVKLGMEAHYVQAAQESLCARFLGTPPWVKSSHGFRTRIGLQAKLDVTHGLACMSTTA
jgi:hypothetical protein